MSNVENFSNILTVTDVARRLIHSVTFLNVLKRIAVNMGMIFRL